MAIARSNHLDESHQDRGLSPMFRAWIYVEFYMAVVSITRITIVPINNETEGRCPQTIHVRTGFVQGLHPSRCCLLERFWRVFPSPFP